MSKRTSIVSLSGVLITRLRKLQPYRHWTKKDFIRCQASFEKIEIPAKKSHNENWNLLCHFAARNNVAIPQPSNGRKKKSKSVYKPLPNTTYDGANGFTQWRKVRYEALKRAGGACECCGATPKSSGGPLHVDHIKPKSIHPELAEELSNLQVLCADCNVGKGNWDETNWRGQREVEEVDRELDLAAAAEIRKILN